MTRRKKLRSQLNLKSKEMNSNVKLTDLMVLKEKLKKSLLGDGKFTYDDIDAAIFKPSGYTKNVFQRGDLGQVWDLYELVAHYTGIKDVRGVFRRYLKSLNITIASASKVLFPDKSSSYLSTMLNEDNNRSYSDDLINKTLIDFKTKVQLGFIRIGENSTYQEIVENMTKGIGIKKQDDTTDKTEYIGARSVNDLEFEKFHETRVIKKEELEKMNYLIITNYKTRKQEVVNIENRDYKIYDDFFKSLQKVMETSQDVSITPFSTKEQK